MSTCQEVSYALLTVNNAQSHVTAFRPISEAARSWSDDNVRCLLLDWYHWMSVLVMNFYFYLWLLKLLWPENTSSHMTRHFEFIIEQVTGSTGSPGRWIPGSLGRWVTKCDPVPSLLFTSSRARNRPHTCQLRWTRSVEDKMHDAAKLFNSFYVAFVTGI